MEGTAPPRHAVLVCHRDRQVVSSVLGCGGVCTASGAALSEFTAEGGGLGPVVLGDEKAE